MKMIGEKLERDWRKRDWKKGQAKGYGRMVGIGNGDMDAKNLECRE
jgi:hypothetical protein